MVGLSRIGALLVLVLVPVCLLLIVSEREAQRFIDPLFDDEVIVSSSPDPWEVSSGTYTLAPGQQQNVSIDTPVAITVGCSVDAANLGRMSLPEGII